MDPQIQYARTSDGVSIACYATGNGPVVVRAVLPYSHLQAELRDPGTMRTHEAIVQAGTLVRYDHRGFGLSDRDVASLGLDEMVLDLEAVVERLRLERFILLVNGAVSPVALQYVASNPGRVTHLILYPGFARAEGVAWKQWHSLASTAAEDWEYVSEAAMRAAYGWDSEEMSQADAELLRRSITPQTFVQYLQDMAAWDASASVPHVRVPTLLLQVPDARYTTMEETRRLMSELPSARLHIVEGANDTARSASAAAAISAFLGARPAVAPTGAREAGTAVILFTDIADSTSLTEQMGDARFRDASRLLEAGIRAAIRASGGQAVAGKVLGDGVMGVFGSAARAIDAARQCLALSQESELKLHIGLHAGDVTHEGDNVYGGAVNIASRICGLCEPGEILVSQTVRDLARTSAGAEFDDRGEQTLKGIADSLRVFAVRAAE